MIKKKLGQYRIQRKLGEGGFAHVYRAVDEVEGIPVALKIPHAEYVNKEALELFRNEVRLMAKLDHPNILAIKHAGFIDDRFVIVYPLGKGSLADRLGRRLSVDNALHFAEQMIEAVACAHKHRIMHLDIKPENFILFDGNRLRLADFGLARVAKFTLEGSGSGTVGYIAPEQAMGKPTFRSDVFSLGLIIHRMLSGEHPEWPYEKPLPGAARLRRALPPAFVKFLNKTLEVDQKKRFRNAVQMLSVFKRAKPKAVRRVSIQRHHRRRKRGGRELTHIRHKLFTQRFGKALETRDACDRCKGPVSEPMIACPWCGAARKRFKGRSRFPETCRRCGRGRKLDWRFCAWCFGPGFRSVSDRRFSDVRYEGSCASCRERVLMPFSRYCPMCRAKVRRKWTFRRADARCRLCGWDMAGDFWSHCPWCGKG